MPSWPWTCRASTGSSSSGRSAPLATGTSGRPGGVEHGEGVGDDRVHRGVATDTGDRPQVERRVQRGEEQRAGVVDPGVDVEDDGNGHASILPEGPAACRSGFVAAAARGIGSGRD